MGICHGKPIETSHDKPEPETTVVSENVETPSVNSEIKKASKFPFYSPSPLSSVFKNSPAISSVTSTPLRFFKRPFPPPSPAKPIKALLARWHGSVKPNEATIPEGNEYDVGLDKNFGFSKQFGAKYEIGDEVGRGHFGYTSAARVKKGELKGQEVAVKVISKSKCEGVDKGDNVTVLKSKMTTAIAIEDVRREVKILRALNGHKNLVHFYDAYEDDENVYIVMELCKGGELLDRILSRGGKYSEEDAKAVMVQILSVVAFCHLQGVVHRDLKPENFLFTTNEENSSLKVIDFGLSDFVKPDERLNDIVGSAYYVAPEVLHRIRHLPCVLKADPSFDEAPWPSLSSDARDFVKGLLNKDYRKRLTAAQALCHPWLSNYQVTKIPLDIVVFKFIKAYVCSSPLRKSALGALTRHSTDAMKDARVLDYVNMVSTLQYRKLDFEEFCSAAVSVYQLEGLQTWEDHARRAYELFEKDGNRPIMIEELASELGLSPSVPVHVVLQDWIRHADGKLSFLGFVRLLHGFSSRLLQKS
ncbi:hypothetical protein Sjap_012910 [Stephania japonica]|uniref:Protein kinase domain-containing protein n=1 Tax=Stephania japonica TaxID=461633 RepID=A0AAP0NY43_9MAGN